MRVTRGLGRMNGRTYDIPTGIPVASVDPPTFLDYLPDFASAFFDGALVACG